MSPFDIQRMLIDEFPLAFLLEVGFRATFAFLAVFLFLKSSGRRGIRQLSLFELVVILTLGSAAGDVSFYHDVPLLPVAVVFLTLLLLYRLTVLVMTKSKRFEAWMDGLPVSDETGEVVKTTSPFFYSVLSETLPPSPWLFVAASGLSAPRERMHTMSAARTR